MKTKKIEFTEAERNVVEESFQKFLDTVTVITRLHGIRGNVQIAEDRSGFTIQVPEDKVDG